MRKLLPLLLALVGLGSGVGAGLALRPDHEASVEMSPCGPTGDSGDHDLAVGAQSDAGKDTPPEFVKLNNQFIVPVVDKGAVAALVILSMSLEVKSGTTEKVFAMEPKLRDLFLQVLFDHANAGGFDGNFTASGNMEVLRNGLVEVARKLLGAAVENVLIENIVRQDA